MKNANKQFIVKNSQLPLACNGSGLIVNKNFEPASLHPKVYLDLTNSNKITNCPYCDAQYILLKETNNYD